MDTLEEILRALGRIEGELVEIRKLTERVSRIERCLAWLKGVAAVLGAALAQLCKVTYGK